MKNRDGYTVEVSTIQSVEMSNDGGCAITRNEPGWGTFVLSKEELNGFVPQAGDVIIVYTQGFSMIRGVVIDGHVLRYVTPAQADAEHEQWVKNYRLEKLERYLAEGAALKARVEKLDPALQARMDRFARAGGEEFWIDSAEYEMYALEGAQAILDKTANLFGAAWTEHSGTDAQRAEVTSKRIKWAEDWWALTTKEHDYNYKKQMEMLPEFGDGHSGNTASAAYGLALRVLRKEPV